MNIKKIEYDLIRTVDEGQFCGLLQNIYNIS